MLICEFREIVFSIRLFVYSRALAKTVFPFGRFLYKSHDVAFQAHVDYLSAAATLSPSHPVRVDPSSPGTGHDWSGYCAPSEHGVAASQASADYNLWS